VAAHGTKMGTIRVSHHIAPGVVWLGWVRVRLVWLGIKLGLALAF